MQSRYTTTYIIELNHISKIYKKAIFLIDTLDSYYLAEIATCKASIERLEQGLSIEDNTISLDEEVPEREKSTLEQIEELGKAYLANLSPTRGVQKSYYLNYIRMHDYLNLFCTIRSTLNVCILALEDQQDLTLNIKNKEADVKMVLEFVKHMIPLEEANFLDDVRKLIFPNEHERLSSR